MAKVEMANTITLSFHLQLPEAATFIMVYYYSYCSPKLTTVWLLLQKFKFTQTLKIIDIWKLDSGREKAYVVFAYKQV